VTRTRRRSLRSIPILSALAVTLGSLGAPIAASAQSPAIPADPTVPTDVQAFMTLYGWADNSPPGPAIAHPCLHGSAGGVGTYSDPISFATDVNELGWCQIIYVPYMQRYFIHEDECSECDYDWNHFQLYRFDMWAGGDSGSRTRPEKKALRSCESTWTRANSIGDPDNPTVIVDPPSNLQLTTTPIFSGPTSCWSPIAVANPGKQTTGRGAGVTLHIDAVDTTAGQTPVYDAGGLPAGLSIDPASGLISGAPTASGRRRVTVTVADAYDSAGVTFIWTVKRH